MSDYQIRSTQQLFEEDEGVSHIEENLTDFKIEDEQMITNENGDIKTSGGGEPDLAGSLAHIQQLLTELQIKRKEASRLVETAKRDEIRQEEARNAARRTAIAEEFARSVGEAAQRLAKETEAATRRAAAVEPLLEAKTLEIEALQAEIRSLRGIVDGVSRREADEKAKRASDEAARKSALANFAKLHVSMAEVQKRTRSLELSLESVEAEVRAASVLLDQEREERGREKAAAAQDREMLKKAAQQIAALTAEVSKVRARAGAA